MKKLTKVLAFICAAVMLAGCGSSFDGYVMLIENTPSAPNDYRILSFFGNKSDFLALGAIDNILTRFMDYTPDIVVNYEGEKTLEYWDALDRRLESGQLDDIFMISHDSYVKMYKAGVLSDLSHLSTVAAYDDFIKTQFTAADGSVYFIPICVTTYGLYVNRDMLNAHGQKVPENPDEFAAVCDYFVSQGITPIIANNFSSLRSFAVGRALYPVYKSGNASEYMDRFNKDPDELAETLRSGLELVREMADRNWIDCDEAKSFKPWSDEVKEFLNGTRPFMITDGTCSSLVASANPEFSYGIYPYPVSDTDGFVVVAGAITCLSAKNYGEHITESLTLIESMTAEDSLTEYCASLDFLVPIKDKEDHFSEEYRPSYEVYKKGNVTMCADYRVLLPIDKSLEIVTYSMMDGLSVDDAVEMMKELLKN